MAGKAFGGTGGKLQLQPGSVITEEQDYSLKGKAVFEGDVSYWPNRPKRGDPHPKNKNALCFALETTYLKLRKVRVECSYLGIDQDPTPYFLEFVGSVGEEAIETHPNFSSIIGGTPTTPLNQAQFDGSTGEFLGFPANAPDHLGGVRTYYRPSVIVRTSYWTNHKPNPSGLGIVVSAGAVPGLVLPPNCNDLLITNFGYRTPCPQFPPFQVTVELLASGPLGWNLEIYNT